MHVDHLDRYAKSEAGGRDAKARDRDIYKDQVKKNMIQTISTHITNTNWGCSLCEVLCW